MTCLKQGIKAVKLTSVMRTFPDVMSLTPIFALRLPTTFEHFGLARTHSQAVRQTDRQCHMPLRSHACHARDARQYDVTDALAHTYEVLSTLLHYPRPRNWRPTSREPLRTSSDPHTPDPSPQTSTSRDVLSVYAPP